MYKNYFSINKNFQSSINIELDLNDENKINEYVPTTDICDVLKYYLNSVIGRKNKRATTLVGPYGKGKSFLLLVLIYILSKNKNNEARINLCTKIKKVDEELYRILLKIKKDNICMCPIIINSNYDNVVQSFQIALNEALERENITNLLPKTVFDVCLELINKREKDSDINDKILRKCIEITNINTNELKEGLRKYSPKSYDKFVKLYNCVSIGLDFNPLINEDVVKTYRDVSSQISKHGYSGLFIIFDEFSKFLESNSINKVKDLKIIQDFAELASRSSKNEQINLCCITHKNLPHDTFKTIEGRFSVLRFNRSIDENYQIIAYAIEKKNDYKKVIKEYLTENKEFYNRIKNVNLYDKDDIETTLFQGCFPLNPITVYALIRLSEMVAQNERTLFTFLSDSDEHSFNSFISNQDSGLFNVDKIYDYFCSLFQREETNSIRNIWYRTESILSKIKDLSEKRLIKTLSIILMINDFEKLPPTVEILSLSTQLDETKINSILKSLMDAHILRRNLLNNIYSFSNSSSKSIEEKIEYLSKTKFKSIRYADILNKINDKRFLLPRKYNEQHKITCFYETIFLSEDEFQNIINFSSIMNDGYRDGLIINLLINDLSSKDIERKLRTINEKRVIVKYPKTKIKKNFYEILLRYHCLDEIYSKMDQDEISKQEVLLLKEEIEFDVKELIEKYFYLQFNYVSLINTEKSFDKLLSRILEEIYTKRIKFNNELINKQNVSKTIKKSASHVIDYLLDKNASFDYSNTSSENFIKESVLERNADDQVFREVIETIKEKLINSNSSKISVKELMHTFSVEPFGIRYGILPLLLAQALSELSDNIIMYFQNAEIPLKSEYLMKSIYNDNYFLKFSKASTYQILYLDNMMKLFNVESSNDFRTDTAKLSEAIHRYFLGLPNIIRSITINNNFLQFDSRLIEYKKIFLKFNINSFEAVFIDPKKIFKTENYEALFKDIHSLKDGVTLLLNNYKNKLLKNIKRLFSINDKTSLKMGLTNWLKSSLKAKRTPILEDSDKTIINCINNDLSYDDLYSLNLLVKATIGLYIEDCSNDISNDLINKLNSFINNILKAKYLEKDQLAKSVKQNSELSFSTIGNLLKNNIQTIINEYSDSVSSSEKIEILNSLIREIIN